KCAKLRVERSLISRNVSLRLDCFTATVFYKQKEKSMHGKFGALFLLLFVVGCANLRSPAPAPTKPLPSSQDIALAIKAYGDVVEPITKLAAIFKKTQQFYASECSRADPVNDSILSAWRARNDPLI